MLDDYQQSGVDFLTYRYKQLEGRLKELCLAFQKEHAEEHQEPSLKDGDAEIFGREELDQYINDIASNLDKWHFGSCC